MTLWLERLLPKQSDSIPMFWLKVTGAVALLPLWPVAMLAATIYDAGSRRRD